MRRVGSKYFHRTVFGFLLYSRMHFMSFRFKSSPELNTPRVILSSFH
jgi:hypothetical protein